MAFAETRDLNLVLKLKDQASSGLKKAAKSIISANAQVNKLRKSTNTFTSSMSGIGSTFSKEFGLMTSAANLAKNGVLALGAGVAGIGVLAIKSAADMEKMRVSLKTSFKGNEEEANKAFGVINEFTAKTPFQLEEVMTGFIKLKNMGLDPSKKALTSYGDTASAMGKSLDQMVEAVADAATGEFERLKEFGIKASSEGDKVTFTFRGVKKTIKKDSASIEKYLIDLGETEFAGGMAEQSKTLSGLFSTLKDQITLTLAEMADKSGSMDILKNGLKKLMEVIEKNKDVVVSFVKNGIQKAVDAVKKWYESVGGADGINDALKKTWEMIKTNVIPTMQELFDKIVWLMGKIVEYKDEIWFAIKAFYALKIAMAGADMLSAFATFGKSIGGMMGSLGSLIAKLGATQWAVSLLSTAMSLLPAAIVIGIAFAAGEFVLIMKQIKQINDATDEMTSNVKKMSKTAQTLIKKRNEALEAGDYEKADSYKQQIENVAKAQRSVGVNDAVITPKGDIVKTHPQDYIIATKRPQDLMSGGGTTVNVNFPSGMIIDRNNASQIVDIISQELRTKLRI